MSQPAKWPLARVALLAFVAVMAVGAAAGTAEDKQAETASEQPLALLKQAEHSLQLHLAEQAMPVLQRLLTDYPESPCAPWARLRMAEALHLQRRFDEGVSVALELASKHAGTVLAAWAQFMAGACYADMGTADYLAVGELLKVVEGYSYTHDQGPLRNARLRLAEVINRISLYDPAFKGADRMLGVPAGDRAGEARSLALEAAVQAELGDFARANDAYARLRSGFPEQKAEIGRAAADLGVRYLRRLATSPASSTEADARKLATAREAAKALLRAPRELVPTIPGIVAPAELTLARYLFDVEKNVAEAGALFRRVYSDFPASPEAAEAGYYHGRCLQLQGDVTKAAQVWEVVAARHTGSGYQSPALCALADCRLALKQPQEALSALATVGILGEEEWKALADEKAAACYRALGRREEAITLLQQAAARLTQRAEALRGHLDDAYCDEIARRAAALETVTAELEQALQREEEDR